MVIFCRYWRVFVGPTERKAGTTSSQIAVQCPSCGLWHVVVAD